MDVEKLVGIRVAQLLKKPDWDTEIIPSPLQKLCYKMLIFKINLTDFNWKQRADDYPVE